MGVGVYRISCYMKCLHLVMEKTNEMGVWRHNAVCT